jgi:hypothetical protein
MKTHILRTTLIALALLGMGRFAMPQTDTKPASGPSPDQTGSDSSMAAPQSAPGQLAPAGAIPSGSAPTATAAPKIPSAQNDTAQFNPTVAEKDKQPTVFWTLGLNDEKNLALLKSILRDATYPGKVQGLTPGLGELVPISLALYPLPDSAAGQMPNVQQYKFARVGKDILLVDPNIRAVVAVLKN